jgi:hypothetical protein
MSRGFLFQTGIGVAILGLGLGVAMTSPGAAQVPAAKSYLLHLSNGVGPGGLRPIQATVRTQDLNWSGTILYHNYYGFQSKYPVYNIRVTWRDQVIQGTFRPYPKGRVLEVGVKLDPKTRRIYFWQDQK